ncbi:DUF4430 domain-containing protein [Enterococcus sp. BWB1-3]|uniref:DUF4430 domain-containing protein n=1 Tax=unclassified Enterococcus TaxID=2608891 RepID=UPI0019220827|nr:MULTISPECIES: DUF4430 domain-containing protein [unclassified Enterococcus]MBL1228511.1 DUF4430 domain-containing protein [Enterococcus sp. BWB1-3]MCB5950516.1 DUF4430 domain-containing protein [Enterococcus sp. BWT-B8]
MKQILAGSIVIAGLLMISGCSGNSGMTADSTTEDTRQFSSGKVEENQITALISLVKDGEEVAGREVSFKEGSDLMMVLKANYEVAEDSGMIQAIDGIEQNADEGCYWTYTINEEMVNTGANETILKDGDKVVFTYAKF